MQTDHPICRDKFAFGQRGMVSRGVPPMGPSEAHGMVGQRLGHALGRAETLRRAGLTPGGEHSRFLE